MQFLICLLYIVYIVFALAEQDDSDHRRQFDEWRLKYQKTYDGPDQLEIRYQNFLSSLKRIKDLQFKFKHDHDTDSQHQLRYGLTKYSDLTVSEFESLYLSAKNPVVPIVYDIDDYNTHRLHNSNSNSHRNKRKAVSLSAFDWRSKGAVTPVKDQGQCGSCWAHSVVEEIESMWFISKGVLPVLSPQQIVDCDFFVLDNACSGGTTQFAYYYVQEAGGLMSESDYPYQSGTTGKREICVFNETESVATVKGFNYATPMCLDFVCDHQDESLLEANLLTGPVSICVDATPWQDYVSGVMTGPECGHGLLETDHCVQLVGYNQTSTPPYWIVRNSWGGNWGEEGFIFLEMGTNTCGVANMATQVVI